MSETEAPTTPRWHVVIFFVLAAGLALGGSALHRARTRHVLRLHRDRMEATTRMLSERLARWRQERLADAQVLSLASEVAGHLEDLEGADRARTDDLRQGLESVRRLYDYEAVAVLDSGGRVRVAVPSGAGAALDPGTLPHAPPVLLEGWQAEHRHVDVTALAEVVRGGRVLGFIALTSPVDKVVGPLQSFWPATGGPGGVLLVSNQSGRFIALSPARPRSPAGDERAAGGVLGATEPLLREGWGYLETRDARGKEVLVVAGRVPSSPWFVLVKTDREEALASDRPGLILTVVLLGALVALAGAGTHLVWLTQRRAAEKQVVESRRRYDTLFRNALTGVAIHRLLRDGSGRAVDYVFLEVNPAFERLTGLKRREVVGRRVTEAIPGIEQTGLIETYAGVVLSGEARRIEVEAPPLERHYEVAVFPMGGEIFGTIFADITPRREAEAALQANEGYLRALFEGALDPVLVADDEGRWVDLNPAAARAFGRPRDEILGRPAEEFAAEGDDGGFARSWRAFFEAGQMTGILRVRRGDGTVRTHEFAATARVQPGRHLWVLRDVTERIRSEEALAESEALFRLVLETIPVGVWLLDRAGHVTYANPAARRIWGGVRFVGPDQFDVFKAWRVPGREPVEPDEWGAVRALEKGVATYAEALEIEAFDGVRRQILSSALPIRDQAGRVMGVLVTNEDVTEQKRLEEHVQQAQKMEAVGRLAGGVAHDFNNLLAIIGGRTGALEKLLSSEHEGRRHLGEINDATERATALTRQLLAFGRRQVLQRRPVRVGEVVERMTPMLRRLLGEDVELRTALEEGMRAVMADPHQLEQVILNLAVNARDALPDGGTLSITAATVVVEQTPARWRRDGPKPGHHALLEVADNGEGMDAETRRHVFEPFFTTKEASRGTGLGLSTVYGIVTQNGGHISVESEPGRGTHFRIHLPFTDETVGEERAASPGPPPPGTETLLLVEDERSLRDLIKDELEDLGYTVHSTGSPAEALELAATHDLSLDLVLTDVILPQMNGRELVARLSADQPGIAAVYMSGYTADVIARHGVLEPGVHFLQKPFPVLELAVRVREALDSAASS